MSDGAVTPNIRVKLALVTQERDSLRELVESERAHRRTVEQALALALRQLPATDTADPPATAAEESLSSTESIVEVAEDGRSSGEVRPSTPTPPTSIPPVERVKRRGWRQWFSG